MKLTRRQLLKAGTAIGAAGLLIPTAVKFFEQQKEASVSGNITEDVMIPTHCKGCAADNRCH